MKHDNYWYDTVSTAIRSNNLFGVANVHTSLQFFVQNEQMYDNNVD